MSVVCHSIFFLNNLPCPDHDGKYYFCTWCLPFMGTCPCLIHRLQDLRIRPIFFVLSCILPWPMDWKHIINTKFQSHFLQIKFYRSWFISHVSYTNKILHHYAVWKVGILNGPPSGISFLYMVYTDAWS